MAWTNPTPGDPQENDTDHITDHILINDLLDEIKTKFDNFPGGAPGAPGASVELRTNAGNIEWRVVGDSTWNVLVALSAITGPAGADGVPGLVALNAQTANYTLVLSDAGKAVEMSATDARTVTVPQNSSVAFPIGTVIEIARTNTGSVTIVAGTGTTLRSAGGLLALRAQYSVATIRKRATNEWVVAGDLA